MAEMERFFSYIFTFRIPRNTGTEQNPVLIQLLAWADPRYDLFIDECWTCVDIDLPLIITTPGTTQSGWRILADNFVKIPDLENQPFTQLKDLIQQIWVAPSEKWVQVLNRSIRFNFGQITRILAFNRNTLQDLIYYILLKGHYEAR